MGTSFSTQLSTFNAPFTISSVRKILFSHSDQKYKEFTSKLLPGTPSIIGVRLPLIRKVAKSVANSNWRAFLSEIWNNAFETGGEDVFFEEKMLCGMILGSVKNVSLDELLYYCKYHIQTISNWSLCDSFCSSFKIAKKSEEHAQYVWNFIRPYVYLPDIPSNEFQVRFALVMMLTAFFKDAYIEKILDEIEKSQHTGYYVKMAKAWVLSMCLIHFPESTEPRLFNSAGSIPLNLDEFTWKKTLQKIIESKRCTKELREKVNMRRKGEVI